MHRSLRKRKQTSHPSTRSSAAASCAESPSTSEPPCKKAAIEEDVEEIKEELTPIPQTETENKEDKIDEEKSKDIEQSETKEKSKVTDEKTSEETKTVGKVEEIVKAPTPEADVPETIALDETEIQEPVDPYACLSETDRKLFQTDIVEFLKRFTPRYFVPVYRTWSIPKSVAKQNL